VIYRAYEAVPRLWDISALEDQSIAGVIMWVPGSLAFLLPVLWLLVTAIAAPAPGRGAAARHHDWPPRPRKANREHPA